jgi:hypothetical protein
MYGTVISDLPYLCHTIVDAVMPITLKMVRNIWPEVLYQLDVFCTAWGVGWDMSKSRD